MKAQKSHWYLLAALLMRRALLARVDIAIQETGATHQPIADDDGECIVFAINEGNIRLASPYRPRPKLYL